MYFAPYEISKAILKEAPSQKEPSDQYATLISPLVCIHPPYGSNYQY